MTLRAAKYLQQLQSGAHGTPVEILALAKAKEPQNDSLGKFAAAFGELKRVGHVAKEIASGKFAEDWNKAVEALNEKPENVDVTVAISAILAVKDEEELVRRPSRSLSEGANSTRRNSSAQPPTLRRR